MKGEKSTRALLVAIPVILVLSMAVIGGLVNTASAWSAQPPPNRVYLDPAEKKYSTPWSDGSQLLGTQFNISLKVENISAGYGRLRGLEFKVWYNTNLLDLVSLTTVASFSFWTDKSNETIGLVWAGGVLSPCPSGNITAFKMLFNITYAPPYCETTTPPKNCTVSCPLKLNETELTDYLGEIYEMIHWGGSVDSYREESGYYEYARECKPVVPPTSPTAAFTWSPTVPFQYDTVTLNASTSKDGGAPPLTYLWTIEGPATLTGPTNTMTTTMHCDGPGTVNVTLTVTNNIPLSDTVMNQIEQLPKVHDVAITDIRTSSYEVDINDPSQLIVTISVDVANEGNYTETVDVKISYDTTFIDAKTAVLPAGGSETVDFDWNLTGLELRTYTIKAEAILATDEDLSDNTVTSKWSINIIPEFPTAVVTPLLLIATLATILLTKMFRSRKPRDDLIAE